MALDLQYKTSKNMQQCIDYLKNKNIHDIFEYHFKQIIDNEYGVIFTKCLTHLCGNKRTKYKMHLIEIDGGTLIKLIFIDELFILPVPCIPELWISEFMECKLNALYLKE